MEIILALYEQIKEILLSLYNECLFHRRVPTIWKQIETEIIWKCKDRDPVTLKSCCPICILPAFGKLQGKLIYKLLEQQRQVVDKHPHQTWWTGHLISSSTYMIVLFVEIGNLWWPVMFRRLRDLRCFGTLYKSFRQYYQDRCAGVIGPDRSGRKHNQEIDQRLLVRVSLWSNLLSYHCRITLWRSGRKEQYISLTIAYTDTKGESALDQGK